MGEILNISPILASILVVVLPLIAFIFQAVQGKKAISGNISLIAIVLSTVLSGGFVLTEIWNNSPQTATYNWFTIGTKTFTMGVLLNNLTVLMQFIVCIIALPVHIYSKAYMKGDPGIHRYWMYLSLFCFAMLGLTISKNLLMMYLFWELVGFASYLLIGYWFTKESAVQANKKAFLINKIGDLGFLIGLACIFSLFGTLDLAEILGKDGLFYQGFDNNTGLMTLAGIGFFLGAMAKSAQFPLHIWLPDAMEGPTSVSSLIHAATMVAAGVFLLSSLFPLFNETVLIFIAVIGAITAVISAYFALGQYDIKKILAYSTISQLGYMVVAVGIGAWDAAMFHLATHAFFKCLLFLSAGAVIHEMAHLKLHTTNNYDPQDLRNMGGLRKQMPKTFLFMSIASLALAGFPLTSGFLSKDAIVISSFEWAIEKGGIFILIPIVLVLVSIATSFYISRLIFKAFFGEFRLEKRLISHIQEAPKTMLYPMLFLAICSLFFIFSLNPISYHHAAILDGLSVQYIFKEIHALHILIPIILTITALCASWISYRWYVLAKYPLNPDSKWVISAQNQFGINDFADNIIVKGTLKLSTWCYGFDKYIIDGIVNSFAKITKVIASITAWFDKYIVDGLVNTIAGTAYYIGHLLRWVQNGRLQNYLGFAMTVVLIGIIYLILR